MDKNIFVHYINLFINHLHNELNRSAHTLRAYKADLDDIVTYWESVQEHDFKKMIYTYLQDHLRKKVWDKKSLARKISCINTFERFLLTQQIIIELHLKRPVIIEAEPEFLSLQDIIFLLDKVPESQLQSQYPHRDKAIFELLYATGIRPSELIQLQIMHINIDQRTLLVRGSKNKERVLLFGKKASEQIERYLQFERQHIVSHHEHIFLNHKNEPLTTRSIQRICNMFSSFLNNTMIITPSLLRHSCAVHLLQEGSDLELVRELLGTTRMSVEKYLPIIHRDQYA